MTQKTPCPECGELNYGASAACWKCGSSMKPKPPAPPAAPAEPGPVPSDSQPAESIQHPASSIQEADSGPQPSALSPQPSPAGPKPAELEAAALKDKDFVTPPVDVEEKPTSLAEWIAYCWAAITSSGSTFREALDEYDRQRGRKSGGVSSYGCVLMILSFTIIAVLAVPIIAFLARNFAR